MLTLLSQGMILILGNCDLLNQGSWSKTKSCFDEFRDIFRLAWTKASKIITRNNEVFSHIKKRRL